MSLLFAFDRDLTVDVNCGAVPLEWVKLLAKRHLVYSVGNPRLGPEAGIPTHNDVKDECKRRGLVVVIPAVSLKHVEDGYLSNAEGKIRRLSRLSALFGRGYDKIIVDDIDLSTMPGWTYFHPDEFYAVGIDRWL